MANEQITSGLVIKQPDSGQQQPLPNGSVQDANILAGVQISKLKGVASGSIPYVDDHNPPGSAENPSPLTLEAMNAANSNPLTLLYTALKAHSDFAGAVDC
jgi:hypothetical protein